MKYTNENLKQSYAYPRNVLILFLCLLTLGLALVVWGFVDASMRFNIRYEMADIAKLEGNHADKIASITAIKISKKIAEDKYVGYFWVDDDTNTYLVGMDNETYISVSEKFEVEGKVLLEGTTQMVIDKDVQNVIVFLEHECDDIYLNVHKVTFVSILKTRVQLILGGVLTAISLFGALGMNSELNRFRKVTSLSGVSKEVLDQEANSKDSISYSFGTIIAPTYLIGHRTGFTAFRYNEIISVTYYPKKSDNPNYRIVLKAADDNEYELYRAGYALDTDEMWEMFDELKKRNPDIAIESAVQRNVNDEYESDEGEE